MLKELQKLPRADSLEKFLQGILATKSDRILSIVLFGSMAKGNYTKYSDYDVLIAVSHEKLSFKERLYEYSFFSDGWVESFVYTKEEIEEMFKDFNPLLLDSLKDGIIMYDKGFWKDLKTKFELLLEKKIISVKKDGWAIATSPINFKT